MSVYLFATSGDKITPIPDGNWLVADGQPGPEVFTIIASRTPVESLASLTGETTAAEFDSRVRELHPIDPREEESRDAVQLYSDAAGDPGTVLVGKITLAHQ